MATYYVHKGVGSNSNNGLSWANAFASLGKANQVAGNSDTIWVRAGATPYEEQLSLSRSGQRWLADPGHQPVINGRYHDGLSNFNVAQVADGVYVVKKQSKTVIPALVKVEGSENEIDGFKICNSAGGLFVVTGHDNYAHHLRIDFAYATCILVSGDGAYGNLIEDCETSRGSIQRFTTTDAAYFDEDGYAYISVCNAMKQCGPNTFRRVLTHHNNGEGLVIGKGSEGCVMEQCVGWNNYHMVFYINNARNATVRFCTAWVTRNPEMLRNGGPTECVVIGDEENGNNDVGAQFVRGQKVYGNIFVGGKYGIDVRQGSNYVTQLRDAYIGYNTFVAVPGVTVYQARIRSGPRAHENSIFENNIFYSPSNGVNQQLFHQDGNPGVRGRNNIIFHEGHSPNIPSWMEGPGNILADPKLTNPKAVIVDNGGVFDQPVDGGNNFNDNNYLLTSTSPAINAAVTTYPFNNNPGVEQARQKDRFGTPRTNPDIGADEYGDAPANSVTAAFTRQPAATTLVEGATVVFTNTSFTGGTADITGQTWTVRKAGVVVATATTENYQYTFATEGSYTVELAVTATGGLSDNEIIAYTVTTGGGGVVVTAAFNASPSQTTIPQGTTVAFTDQSTVQNGALASRAWAVLALPGLTTVASGTGATFNHTFATVGGFRVRLTATATTGESDQEERDYTVTSVTTPTVTAGFTSSDVDGIVDEGDAVTFTNTSTVANTTISGYLWSVTRLGGGSAANYTTTNMSHTFSQAGTYLVTLQANTAAGVSDTETMTIIVQGQTSAGMDVMVVPQAFTAATSTGTQTITAAALGTKTPKGVHIRMVGATSGGTAAAGALWSEGAASETAQWVHCRFSDDGEATTKAWRRYSMTKALMSIDENGAVTGAASFVRFVPGGMELNVTDAFPAGYLCEAVFYAGDEMEFWAGSTAVGTQDEGTPVTPGFEPDAVYLASCWASAEDTAEAHAELSRGWAVRGGTQYHYRNRDDHGEATSDLVTRLQPRIGSSAEGSNGYCSIEAREFSAAGFRLVPLSSSLSRVASLFAFRAGGHGVSLGLAQLPTGGALEYLLPFEAQTVLASSGSFYSQNGGQLGGADAEGQGWYTLSTHGAASFGGSVAADNGAATSATRSLWATGFRAVAPDGSLLWNGVGSLDADGFNVTWTAAPAQGYRVIVLAVEVGEILEEPGEEPVADFTVEVEPDEDLDGRTSVWFDGSISNGRGETIDTYAWTFGDGGTSAEVAPVHVYEEPGDYSVSLTVATAAGSDTKTLALTLPDLRPIQVPILVGPIDPATSGGDTGNYIDEEMATHTHEIAGAFLKLREMTASEYATFEEQEADPVYAWVGLYNRQFVVKFTDGTMGAVAIA